MIKNASAQPHPQRRAGPPSGLGHRPSQVDRHSRRSSTSCVRVEEGRPRRRPRDRPRPRPAAPLEAAHARDVGKRRSHQGPERERQRRHRPCLARHRVMVSQNRRCRGSSAAARTSAPEPPVTATPRGLRNFVSRRRAPRRHRRCAPSCRLRHSPTRLQGRARPFEIRVDSLLSAGPLSSSFAAGSEAQLRPRPDHTRIAPFGRTRRGGAPRLPDRRPRSSRPRLPSSAPPYRPRRARARPPSCITTATTGSLPFPPGG